MDQSFHVGLDRGSALIFPFRECFRQRKQCSVNLCALRAHAEHPDAGACAAKCDHTVKGQSPTASPAPHRQMIPAGVLVKGTQGIDADHSGAAAVINTREELQAWSTSKKSDCLSEYIGAPTDVIHKGKFT